MIFVRASLILSILARWKAPREAVAGTEAKTEAEAEAGADAERVAAC